MNKIGFLQDDKGNNSAGRLMSLISLIAAIAIGGYTLLKADRVGNVGTDMTYAFLFAAFGGKVSQKYVEDKKHGSD